jgi:hypothetical protein
MLENSLSVSLWFKSSALNGKILGKEGYTAFGKGYKTFSCSLVNGSLVANPGKLTSEKLTLNTWHQVALCADEKEMTLYLDGKQVAQGLGTKDLSTDALDLFTEHPAAIDHIYLYNKVLNESEIRILYEANRPK